jgi:hypothetical protein
MRNAHEPSSEFVERLEWQVGVEVRRRNRAAEGRQWPPRSRVRLVVAALGLMLVSMGVGAAAVAAAYEAQSSERRDQLAAGFEQRARLAEQRLALAERDLQAIERRVAIGLASNAQVLERRITVAEAQAQVKSIALQLEEIRLTGREPRPELSAPRVSGRDFVGERLRIEMSVAETVAAFERSRLRDAETRFSIGVVDALEVGVVRARALEVEVALDTLRRKIDIRQKLLGGTVDAIETELRVLESEAEQRKKVLGPKLELARKEVDRIAVRVQVGTAQQVELVAATLKRLELETQLAEADLELALVRRRIEQHRGR